MKHEQIAAIMNYGAQFYSVMSIRIGCKFYFMPDEIKNLSVAVCPACLGNGILKFGRCPKCRGFAAGVKLGGRVFHWGRTLHPSAIFSRRAARLFDFFVFLFFSALAIVFLILFLFARFDFLRSGLSFNWIEKFGEAKYLWWSVIFAWFVIYRLIKNAAMPCFMVLKDENTVEELFLENVTREKGSWQDASSYFKINVLTAVERAVILAEKEKRAASPLDFFAEIIKTNELMLMLARFGIPAKAMSELIVKTRGNAEHSKTFLTFESWRSLFSAMPIAKNFGRQRVSLADLFLSLYKNDNGLEKIFDGLGVGKEKVGEITSWLDLAEKIRTRVARFKKNAAERPKGEINRAMTAIATPFLDHFSRDLTFLASRGYLEICIGREKEIEEIFRIFEGGGRGAILVGQPGVGKKTLIEGVAERMINNDVPEILSDKRLVEIDTASVLSGASPADAIERLLRVFREAGRSGNIILVIPKIDQLTGISFGRPGSLDLAEVLADAMNKYNFLVLATAEPEAESKVLSGTVLMNVFSKVIVEEVEKNIALKILEAKSGLIEYRHQALFSFVALERATDLAAKFLRDKYLPASAMELISEAAVAVRNKKGKYKLVTADDIAAIASGKSKVPLSAITEEETDKLLRLEEVMSKRVVGQIEAIGLIANALRRARAGVRDGNRPIANFLFLGPTGVGKTETAKTIAQVYFGGENMMIRLDMSEYQDNSSIYRLLGAPGEKGTGHLTEAVRRAPSSLILLDELEKADPNVLNLFLQVMDDGRLTDSLGRVADFTNTIIIATSNAGTSLIQQKIKDGVALEQIKTDLLHGELNQYFRPEFLNRFDGIVLFQPLGKMDVVRIAGLMIENIRQKLLIEKEIELRVTDQALVELAEAGFDQEFGARLLRRVIQERVENKIAEILLKGEAKRKDKIIFDTDGLRIEKNG